MGIRAYKVKLVVSNQKPKCPDCERRLPKRINGKYYCKNPECPVIYLTYRRGGHTGEISRITRAAVSVFPPEKDYMQRAQRILK